MPLRSLATFSRYVRAMARFSSAMYPLSRTTSIRSSSGAGMVSSTFAVHTNNTLERSTGTSR